MKRFHSSKYMLIALISALLLTGGAVAQECDVPNALLKAQLYNDALTNYTDLLIQKYSPKEKSDSSDLPLADLAIIKEAYAKELKNQGIFSHCDLIRKADTLQAQEALAKKLGISTMLLRSWALLADLMCIVGNKD